VCARAGVAHSGSAEHALVLQPSGAADSAIQQCQLQCYQTMKASWRLDPVCAWFAFRLATVLVMGSSFMRTGAAAEPIGLSNAVPAKAGLSSDGKADKDLPEIDPALRQSPESLSSSNLLANPREQQHELDKLTALQDKLALARQE